MQDAGLDLERKRAEDFQLYLARVEAEKIARLFAWVPKLLVLYAVLALFVWWVTR